MTKPIVDWPSSDPLEEGSGAFTLLILWFLVHVPPDWSSTLGVLATLLDQGLMALILCLFIRAACRDIEEEGD